MPETTASSHGSRLTKVLSVVGALTALASVVVGVLVYFQSRPSGVDDFHQQVDTLCKTAASRQAPLLLTLNERGLYDRPKFIAAVSQDIEAARANLEDLRKLKAPDELQAEHAAVVTSFQQVLEAGSRYAASLPSLPPSEYAKRFPDLPGDEAAYNAAATTAQAGVVALSGGRCQSAK